LSPVKRDVLPFTEIVETSLGARGVVEEILVPVTGQDETKPFVTDEALNRAVHGCHCDLLECGDSEDAWQDGWSDGANACPKAGRRWINAGWLTSGASPQYTLFPWPAAHFLTNLHRGLVGSRDCGGPIHAFNFFRHEFGLREAI
jgi:hypothetical protein